MIEYVSRNNTVGAHRMATAAAKRQVSEPRSSCGTVQDVDRPEDVVAAEPVVLDRAHGCPPK
jgi:hypothetical protein